ncbi:MAG: MFS transporter [Deltaproteobacteria bacterium]|nr:MFS transporter [Deltaproteobacteria bacterium]
MIDPDDRSRYAQYEKLLLICCSLAFASYFASYMRIPVVPLFARELGATTPEVGFINSAFLLMSGALALPLGALSDRWGRKPLVLAGLAISGATSFLLCVGQTPGQLIWIYLLFGCGLAAIGPTLMSYTADISPPTHLGRSYGWYTTAIYTGMSLGPAAGGFLAQGLGFRPLFLVAGFVVFILLGLAAFFLPAADVTRPPLNKSAGSPGFIQLLNNRALLGCWIVTLGGCFGLGMFVTFAPLFAHAQNLTVGDVGLIFTAQAALNALSRIPLGRVTDRLARRRGALSALGFGVLGISLGAFALAGGRLSFLLLAMALGVSMGLAFTPLGALISETVPPEARGLAMGGYNTCIYLGMMLSSAFMGGVIQQVGFPFTFLLTGLLTVAVAAGFYVMIRDFKVSQE